MVVLKILAVLALLWVVYILVQKMNAFTYKHYRYEFLDEGKMILVSFAYYLLAGGFIMYNSALNSGGDILNGGVLMFIGSIFMILNIWGNIKNTNLTVGLTFTVAQLLICTVVSVGAIVILLIATAAASAQYRCYDNNY